MKKKGRQLYFLENDLMSIFNFIMEFKMSKFTNYETKQY